MRLLALMSCSLFAYSDSPLQERFVSRTREKNLGATESSWPSNSITYLTLSEARLAGVFLYSGRMYRTFGARISASLLAPHWGRAAHRHLHARPSRAAASERRKGAAPQPSQGPGGRRPL